MNPFLNLKNKTRKQTKKIMNKKMEVEIWSDVMCPFCYIGKRKFEMALEKFQYIDQIKIDWKSYQLMPDLKTQPNKNINTLLSEAKGISLEEAKEMNNYVAKIGEQIGLKYNIDHTIPANTFNAHRLIQFAKTENKGNEAEERLFEAYFSEGKNIDDMPTLIQLGVEIGLDKIAVEQVLESEQFSEAVQIDIYESQQLGVRGVPFFVFDRKTAISGAQEPQTFLQTLEGAFEEWSKNNPKYGINVIDGQSCAPDGNCD